MRGWAVELPGSGVAHIALKICAQVLCVMGSDVILASTISCKCERIRLQALAAQTPSVAQISTLEASLLLLRPVASLSLPSFPSFNVEPVLQS